MKILIGLTIAVVVGGAVGGRLLDLAATIQAALNSVAL